MQKNIDDDLYKSLSKEGLEYYKKIKKMSTQDLMNEWNKVTDDIRVKCGLKPKVYNVGG